MDRDELIAAIESGLVTPEHLRDVFDEKAGLGEDSKLRALAQAIKTDPESARPFFERLNADRLATAIDGDRLEPPLISLAVRALPSSRRLDDAALRHPQTPTPALLMVAERAEESQLMHLLRDELRLVLSPELARTLARSPRLSEEQRSRLAALLSKLDSEEEFQIREGLRPENMSAEDRKLMMRERESGQADDGEAPKRRENIYIKLQKMTAAEKALLAIHGNREARMLLVRDPNRLVAKAAIRSPRLTERDVESIAQIRDVDEEILRIIASNRRWIRKYSIAKKLALNPRTPAAIALKLLERLSNTDIRLASRDHNLAEVVRKAALRIAKRRGLR